MSEYINLEDAKRNLRTWITDCVLDGDTESADRFRDCIDLLDSLDAADVAPVRRGEWIEYACSAYGGIDEYGDVKWIPKKKFLHEECGRWNAIREPFCPNCGAKMGGKQ